jgi:predicted O-methyltransferase YrrM
MEHFYQDIEGEFDSQMLYTIMVNSAKNGAHFVEVGTAKGQGTAYLAVEIAKSKKNVKLDTVMPTDDVLFEEISNNLVSVKELVTPVRHSGTDAAKLYTDRTLDFVYIHEATSAEQITKAIEAWKVKIKHGGMIAGYNWRTEEIQNACKKALPGVLSIPPNSWMIQVV